MAKVSDDRHCLIDRLDTNENSPACLGRLCMRAPRMRQVRWGNGLGSVFAGYQFNRYLAAEVGYLDAGTGSDLGVDIDSTGVQASVLGSYWLDDSWSIYGRVGLLHWKADFLGPGGTAGADGNDAYYGAGVSLFAEGAYLRLEYDMSQLEDADLSQLTLGIAWRF